MSRQEDTGLVIDSLEFARAGEKRAGSLGISRLKRLADALADEAGALDWSLVGWRDEDGDSWLRLEVRGSLKLRCQRCLGAVDFPAAIDSRLQLVRPGEPWPDDGLEDDVSDAIAADKALSIEALVEDEVLLALPIAPRHENCEAPRAVAVEQEPSPFGVLAKIRKH